MDTSHLLCPPAPAFPRASGVRCALILLLAAFFALLPGPAAVAQTGRTVTDQGDVVAGPVKPVAIFISKLTGRAQYRLSETAQWQPARVGARLQEGAAIRTGPASAVELTIGATQVLTLDRLTTVTLTQAFMEGSGSDPAAQTARTRAELDVGRVKFDVNS